MDWNEQLQAIADNIRQALLEVNDLEGLEQMRMQILGKKGELTLILRGLGNLDPAERPLVGAKVNELRRKFESVLDERKRHFGNLEQDERLLEERIDVTEPGVSMPRGTLHPLTKTLYEMRDIFIGMGFEVKEGPEIELAEYNFDMLNFKPNHPARDMQDTFYINEDVVLRTHTSPVQVRTMLNEKPPIRMICPGRVFRSDEVDATHSPIFNQMEGLVIDKGVTLADLFGTFDVFAKEMYGSKTETRQRPSYFPFTEPSMELDISCTVCGGKGCRVCKDTGWIELGGSGMVHPNVLRMAGIDPEVYSGFAFGWGIDRVANMKYGITDIRLLYENDIRFLEQF